MVSAVFPSIRFAVRSIQEAPGLARVAEVALRALEGAFALLGRHRIASASLLFACYAIRLPFLHFEPLFHFRGETIIQKAGRVLFLVSDAVAALDWLCTIQAVRRVGMANLPYTPLVSVLRGGAYLFFGIHAVKVLFSGRASPAEKDQAFIDLALAVSQVALSVMMLAGAAVPVVYYTLTLAALALTAASVLHAWIRYAEKKS